MCYGKEKEGIAMFEKIEDAMERLRPFIQRDGGDVEFVDFEDGIVYVRLLGNCAHCPSSYITLKGGIEQFLFNEFPNDVVAVEQIM